MMRRQLFEEIRGELSAGYPPAEAEAIALRLLAHYLSIDRAALYLDPRAETAACPALEAARDELAGGRPLQYVLGEAEFYGLRLRVDESVLIPRPETEELVRRVLETCRGEEAPRILDIGTGSGAIAIALARECPGAEVSALDISPAALETARQNAALNGVNIHFSLCDILRQTPEGTYEVIVSNPPYVRLSERAAMRPNVVEHEPPLALFVPDDDPLRFYRAIARRAREGLTPGGHLFFEINEALGPQTAELLAAEGFAGIEIHRDLFGRRRMIKATGRA